MAKKMAMKTKQGFTSSANQSPAVVSLAMGFLFVFAGIVFSSVSGILLELAGIVLLIAGILSIYLLGGANRKR